MRLFVDDGAGRQPVSRMSFMQTKQAAAVMDGIGRLIPHQGVDYDVTIDNDEFGMTPLTDKGAAFKEFVGASFVRNPPDIDAGDGAISAVSAYVAGLVPREGIDYDVEITLASSYNPKVSMNIVAKNGRGEWWKKYVMAMIKKYPPKVENPEPSLPDDPADMAGEEDGKEHEDAQDMS